MTGFADMTNVERVAARVRHSSLRAAGAFTLIELVVVFGLILVLTGLVLSTVGYARKKGARARAETEIAAMSAACESYKADNGVYPRGNADLSNSTPYDTDKLNARTQGDPSSTPYPPDPANPAAYSQTSLYLYKQLSGDTSANLQPPTGAKSYFTFKAIPPSTDGTSNSGMLSITRSGNNYTVNYIRDPFGYSYGYSTANQTDPSKGYNPTFDLWSTTGLTANPSNPDTITPQWIKNW